MADDSVVTEEQANQALLQLTQQPEEEPTQLAEAEPPAKEAAVEPTPEAGTAEDVSAEGAGEPQAAEDDVESLRTRITGLETEGKERETRHESRMKALQQRNRDSEQIMRNRLLRKSDVTQKALRILKAGRTEQGVPEAEVDGVIRELEGTMHPDSASYVAPEPRTASQEDQTLVLNDFLNEQSMTTEEADEFAQFIRSDAARVMSAQEQEVVRESLGGFLRIAHLRWREGLRDKETKAKTDTAVGAAQSVKRTQREAARAASSSPAAPRKQPAGGSKEVDLEKLTPDDVSTLVRKSMDQYR